MLACFSPKLAQMIHDEIDMEILQEMMEDGDIIDPRGETSEFVRKEDE